MKVLGLSFGRRNGNCDVMVKEALLGAKRMGADIAFINTCRLTIDRCTGCGGCDRQREKGGASCCILKDDFPFVEDAILESDALIVAAPVYVLGPVGQYKNLCDRMGPSHDRAFMLRENERREKLGIPLLDERLFKDHFVGLISVGGARTENWTSFGLPGMHLLTFSMQMTVVDQMNMYGMGDRVHPAFHPELMQRLFAMGGHVASAVGRPRLEVEWMGDEDGVCPICHCNLLTVKRSTTVECPVCGIAGKLWIRGDEAGVDFLPEQIAHARLRLGGVIDHCNEINDMKHVAIERMQKDGKKLPALLAHQEGIAELNRAAFEAGRQW